MIATATLAFCVMLRSLIRPRAVLMRSLPPVKSNQTGVTWGEPSGITVARNAKDFFSGLTRSRYFSGIMSASIPPFPIAPQAGGAFGLAPVHGGHAGSAPAPIRAPPWGGVGVGISGADLDA